LNFDRSAVQPIASGYTNCAVYYAQCCFPLKSCCFRGKWKRQNSPEWPHFACISASAYLMRQQTNTLVSRFCVVIGADLATGIIYWKCLLTYGALNSRKYRVTAYMQISCD
jgi:hypothetical protein